MHLLETLPETLAEVDFEGYFSSLGPETHVVVPAEFPESLLGKRFPRFSIGHDLRCLPPKRHYVVLDTYGGTLVQFLRRRFPERRIEDLVSEILIRRVDAPHRRERYRDLPSSSAENRPIMILFSPRSGGAVLARLLNSCGVISAPLRFRSPLMWATLTGVSMQHIVAVVAQSRGCAPRDIVPLVNVQFLHSGIDNKVMMALLDWIIENNVLVLAIRRTLQDQAASLSAALSTDIWEYWGDAPVVTRDFDLNLDEIKKTIHQNMQIFEQIEDLLPAANLLRIQYNTLIRSPRKIVFDIAQRSGRAAAFDLEDVCKSLPSRLRSGLRIGQANMKLEEM